MQSVRPAPLVPASTSQGGLLAKFFRGLGDPTRIRVLQLLLERERTVTELVAETGSIQGRLSSHLTCLRWCGFVTSRREGRRVFYSLADSRISQLLTLAEEFLTDHADAVGLCRVIVADPDAGAS